MPICRQQAMLRRSAAACAGCRRTNSSIAAVPSWSWIESAWASSSSRRTGVVSDTFGLGNYPRFGFRATKCDETGRSILVCATDRHPFMKHSPIRVVILAAMLPALLPAQSPIRDLTPAPSSAVGSFPGPVAALAGIGYFGATDEFGVELWRTDGTAAGTFRLKDINPGSASSDPSDFVAVGNRLFFVARVAGLGRELWVTDGTAAGT